MDLIKALRGELNNCECYAYGSSECGCGAIWPEEVASKAADEIERLRDLLGKANALCRIRQVRINELAAALKEAARRLDAAGIHVAYKDAMEVLAKLDAKKEE